MVRTRSTAWPSANYKPYRKTNGSKSSARQFNNWINYIRSEVKAYQLPKVIIGYIPADKEEEAMECLIDQAKELLTFRR